MLQTEFLELIKEAHDSSISYERADEIRGILSHHKTLIIRNPDHMSIPKINSALEILNYRFPPKPDKEPISKWLAKPFLVGYLVALLGGLSVWYITTPDSTSQPQQVNHEKTQIEQVQPTEESQSTQSPPKVIVENKSEEEIKEVEPSSEAKINSES